MKKGIIYFIVFLLIISNMHAALFAVIGMTGLSFADPAAASIVRNVMCVTGPAGILKCASQYEKGQIVGQVTGEAFQKIAEASPEAAQSISTYNQVKGYVDTGATIINELKINEKGQIDEGTIQFNKKFEYVGNLVGENIKKEDIMVSPNIQFDKKEGVSSFTFSGEKSYVKVRENLFMNVKKQDETTNAYIKLNEGGNVIEADFTVAEIGGPTAYTLGNDRIVAPPNSRVIFKNGKAEIRVPEGGEIKALPTLVDPKSQGNLIEIKGKNVKLPNGAVLEKGILSYQNGQAFVQKGEDITISGVKIERNNQQKSLIFFDGLGHNPKDNYISLNARNKNLILNNNKGIRFISFEKENPFFKIEENDAVLFGMKNKAEISIKNRDEEGLIPSVKIKLMQEQKNFGKTVIASGSVTLAIDSEKITSGVNDRKGEVSSSPMSILVEGPGEVMLIKDKKVIVSNFNEIFTIPLKEKESLVKLKWKGPAKVSEEIYYNSQGIGDFTNKFPNIEIRSGSGEPFSTTELKIITDSLSYMSDDLRKSVRGVVFFKDDSVYAGVSPKSSDAWTTTDRIIRTKNSDFLSSLIYHEAAHDLTFEITDSPFKEFWEKTSKEYRKGLGGAVVGGSLALTWADGTSGPRDGFVNPYGANNPREDIATYVESAYTDPGFFESLIDQKNVDSKIYLTKLKFLRDYGFITQEIFEEITKK